MQTHLSGGMAQIREDGSGLRWNSVSKSPGSCREVSESGKNSKGCGEGVVLALLVTRMGAEEGEETVTKPRGNWEPAILRGKPVENEGQVHVGRQCENILISNSIVEVYCV